MAGGRLDCISLLNNDFIIAYVIDTPCSLTQQFNHHGSVSVLNKLINYLRLFNATTFVATRLRLNFLNCHLCWEPSINDVTQMGIFLTSPPRLLTIKWLIYFELHTYCHKSVKPHSPFWWHHLCCASDRSFFNKSTLSQIIWVALNTYGGRGANLLIVTHQTNSFFFQ